MKGAVRRGRLNHAQFPNRLLRKWQLDLRRTLLRGTYSVLDVDISMNECALDSRPLVLRFGLFRCAVVSSRYIVCLLKNIQIRSMKFAKRYLKFYTLLFKNNFM